MAKNITSEYIRRDFNKLQTVSSNIDFKGDLTVKDATADNNPVNFKQVKDYVAANSPNTAAQKLNYAIFDFQSLYNTASGSDQTSYPRQCLSNVLFLKQNGKQFVMVACSRYVNWETGIAATSNAGGIANYNYQYAWLADIEEVLAAKPDYNYNTYTNATLILDPNNITQEEQDKLNSWNATLLKVRYRVNYKYSSNDNWQSVNCLFNTQKGDLNILTKYSGACGYLSDIAGSWLELRFDFNTDEERSKFKEIVALQFAPFAYNPGSAYGGTGYIVKWNFNGINSGRADFSNPLPARIKARPFYNTPLYPDKSLNRVIPTGDTYDVYLWQPVGEDRLCGKAYWDDSKGEYLTSMPRDTTTNAMDGVL